MLQTVFTKGIFTHNTWSIFFSFPIIKTSLYKLEWFSPALYRDKISAFIIPNQFGSVLIENHSVELDSTHIRKNKPKWKYNFKISCFCFLFFFPWTIFLPMCCIPRYQGQCSEVLKLPCLVFKHMCPENLKIIVHMEGIFL